MSVMSATASRWRPESAVEFEIGASGAPNIAATATLMPRDVAILLSEPKLSADDIAAGLTLCTLLNGDRTARDVLAWLRKPGGSPQTRRPAPLDPRPHHCRPLEDVTAHLNVPLATVAGEMPTASTLSAVRMGDIPVLLVTNAASAHAWKPAPTIRRSPRYAARPPPRSAKSDC